MRSSISVSSRWTAALAAAVVMTPVRVFACPVCFASSSKSVLHQFYATAAGLTLAPFVLVVGVALYLRHVRRRGASAAEPSSTQGGASSGPAETSGPPRNGSLQPEP